MITFKIDIKSDSDDFVMSPEKVVAEMVRKVAAKIEDFYFAGAMQDTNGNTCGSYALTW